jgi:hypothetical protein
MGIGSISSIGSSSTSDSFWQQDQSYWQQQQAQSQAAQAENALIAAMTSAQGTASKEYSQVVTAEAKARVDQQIQTLANQVIGSSSGSSSKASTPTTPNATGTGTVPLSLNTSLLTLGIPANATITVSAGGNTTAYSSTGTDTVSDLINAINSGNAYVSASLNASGHLVIASKDSRDTVSIGGYFASNIGFGSGNTTFTPNASAQVTAVTPQYSTGRVVPAPTIPTGKSTKVQSAASESASSAATLMSAMGNTGTLVNMLA